MVSVATDLRLRPATEADISFLVTLRNRLAGCFVSTVPATADKTAKLFKNSETYIVERVGERVGTFALYNCTEETAEFGRFMVASPAQHQGLGAEILQLALEEAKRLGWRYLHLTVKENNDVALRMYVRAGFHRRPAANGVIPMWKGLV